MVSNIELRTRRSIWQTQCGISFVSNSTGKTLFCDRPKHHEGKHSETGIE